MKSVEVENSRFCSNHLCYLMKVSNHKNKILSSWLQWVLNKIDQPSIKTDRYRLQNLKTLQFLLILLLINSIRHRADIPQTQIFSQSNRNSLNLSFIFLVEYVKAFPPRSNARFSYLITSWEKKKIKYSNYTII